jgi:hypothetical protein
MRVRGQITKDEYLEKLNFLDSEGIKMVVEIRDYR